jgi:hypothetical protein
VGPAKQMRIGVQGLSCNRSVRPALWQEKAARTGFIPGLLPDTFPRTNRPTFQQVLELQH